MENLMEDSNILSIVKEIDAYCAKRFIVGFHYTKGLPTEIATTGLKCRTGLEIRNNFLANHGSIFTQKELEIIQKAWDADFDLRQQKSRDSRIYFNFTTTALNSPGTEPLLTHFGGEQVYMPLQHLDSIGTKIKMLGVAMIIKCVLDPKNLNTFHEYPWGRIAVSTYHHSLNIEAFRDDQDGSQFVNVEPKHIEIIYFDRGCDYSEV